VHLLIPEPVLLPNHVRHQPRLLQDIHDELSVVPPDHLRGHGGKRGLQFASAGARCVLQRCERAKRTPETEPTRRTRKTKRRDEEGGEEAEEEGEEKHKEEQDHK
jgi:hypothetical protein